MTFLEELTGVSGLIPDPTHYWAGLHVNPPGAFQAIHRDFRVHPITGLFHRVNILIYLNSNWKSEYGGELELWKSDKSACGQQVAPVAGKSVIFEAGPLAFHGIPEPINCPTGRARLSLAAIYYTVDPPPNDRKESRSSGRSVPGPVVHGLRDIRGWREPLTENHRTALCWQAAVGVIAHTGILGAAPSGR